MMQTIFECIKNHLPQTIDGDWPGYGLSQDGKDLIQWSSIYSKLTMLLYLNGIEDGIKGGETILFDKGEPQISIAQKQGAPYFSAMVTAKAQFCTVGHLSLAR